MKNIIIALLIWNLCVFFVYAMDKYRACKKMWRISEKTLLICAFLCGGFGAAAGMYCIRHKTRHIKFRILIPVSIVLTTAFIYYVLFNIT